MRDMFNQGLLCMVPALNLANKTGVLLACGHTLVGMDIGTEGLSCKRHAGKVVSVGTLRKRERGREGRREGGREGGRKGESREGREGGRERGKREREGEGERYHTSYRKKGNINKHSTASSPGPSSFSMYNAIIHLWYIHVYI